MTIGEYNIVTIKKKLPKGTEVYEISAVSQMGLNELIAAVIKNLKQIPIPEKIEVEETEIDKVERTYTITKVNSNRYEVEGALIEEIIRRVNLEDYTSNAYFQRQIKEEGIIDALKEKGLKDGDIVVLNGYELEYTD